MEKPHAPACERNRDPILAELRPRLADARRVLEIGSGTGQHAVHFAAAMSWLTWQCTDRAEHLPGMRLWLDEAALPNTPPPLVLDVMSAPWPVEPGASQGAIADIGADAATEAGAAMPPFDAVFSANTLHIMDWDSVEAFFAGVGRVLARSDHGTLAVYGPFNYEGRHTSDSNREFDAWLRARDPRSGIRDAEAVDRLASAAGLSLEADVAMPANNRLRFWTR